MIKIYFAKLIRNNGTVGRVNVERSMLGILIFSVISAVLNDKRDRDMHTVSMQAVYLISCIGLKYGDKKNQKWRMDSR